MPNNFQCTDCCILYPLHLQEKSRKAAPNAEQNFLQIQKLSWGFFYPQAQYER